MRRFINILLGALAMLAVALLSAFLTLRIAIHGREVAVPDLSGLTVPDAVALSRRSGLNLSLENRFYSTLTPSGRILAQSPAPGTKVRRQWIVRITESLGPQRVAVPDVTGETERTAAVNIRRLALELGTVAYIPAPGPADIVLAQTPTANATGIDGPRVSLLVSEADLAPDAHAAASSTAALSSSALVPVSDESTPAFLMPNLIGLTLGAASSRVSAMGLHIDSIEAQPITIQPVQPVGDPSSTPAPAPTQSGVPTREVPLAPLAPITLANTVVAQHPAAGRRVSAADHINITLTH